MATYVYRVKIRRSNGSVGSGSCRASTAKEARKKMKKYGTVVSATRVKRIR